MMRELIKRFPQQLIEACEIGRNANLTPHTSAIRNIVVLGMGGSGIGASLVKDISSNELLVPFEIAKGYSAPSFINENSLVIASSYSGNTEETLASLSAIIDTNCKIVAITTGGKLMQMAKDKHFDYIQIPSGMPPRSCLGYSFIQQLYILNYHRLISSDLILQAEKCGEWLLSSQDEVMQSAETFTEQVFGKFLVIYGFEKYASIPVRWAQQINENSKELCLQNVIPEMNHNELVGWRKNENDKAVVFLMAEDVDYRNKKRKEINESIIQKYCSHTTTIDAKGSNPLERSLYLIHFGDWVSQLIAEKKQIDSTEVEILNFLKNEMAKL